MSATMERVFTREEWLTLAVEQLRPVFREVTGEDIPPVRVSVGFPGGRGDRSNVIGQCWHNSAATDGRFHIFVSPVLDDAPRVLDVLLHELVHATDGNQSGHKGRFAQWAKDLGLAGKMTATVAGEDLAQDLKDLVRWNLGAYPHGALTGGGMVGGKPGAPGPVPGAPGGGTSSHPKQGTRMVKVSCHCDPKDPYILRMTRKQIDRGLPGCGLCGERMSEDVSGGVVVTGV